MMVVSEMLPCKTLTTHDAAAPSRSPQTRGGGGGDGRGVRVVGVGGDAGPAWPQGKLFVEVTWKAQVAFPPAMAFPLPLGPYSASGLPPREASRQIPRRREPQPTDTRDTVASTTQRTGVVAFSAFCPGQEGNLGLNEGTFLPSGPARLPSESRPRQLAQGSRPWRGPG